MTEQPTTPYTITRAEIVAAGRELLGIRFLHQGRNPEAGVDCVGVLNYIGRRTNYPHLVDLTVYKRVPSSSLLRDILHQALDEIPVEEAGDGDFYFMRMGGIKPRHLALRATGSDGTPSVIHAYSCATVNRVVEQSARFWMPQVVGAFRARGLRLA